MVVTAQHHATDAGLEILQAGGNAVDAAVAVGYALAVAEPCCGNIGGGGFLLLRYSKHPRNKELAGKMVFLNFREKAPGNISNKLFIKEDGKLNSHKLYNDIAAVAVPGTVMGLNYALEEYGSLPRAKVMQPAIDLAEKGIVVSKMHETLFARARDKFAQHENIANIFLKNGESYKAGEMLKQRQLASTLKLISQKGTEVFYHGEIMHKIVDASQHQGGVLTQKDFANYTISEAAPIHCTYRGYDIYSAPPPSSGGVSVCEALGILEAYPLSQYGYQSIEGNHLIVEALRHTFADRNQYLGDPDFIHNPIDRLLSKSHAEKIRQKIHPDKTGGYNEVCFHKDSNEKMNTTHYSVVDEWGNAVSLTYTIDAFYGAKVMAGDTGFFLNNEIADFQILLGKGGLNSLVQSGNNLLAPNKRPLSSMAPTIITKDGKLRYVLGTPGGPTIISSTVHVIINLLDYGMTPKQATDAPRYHSQCTPDRLFVEPNRFSEASIHKLTTMGHQVQKGSIYGRPEWGAMTVIEKDPSGGSYRGAIDRRRPAGKSSGISVNKKTLR